MRIKRRINHTGRKKIDRAHIIINLTDHADGTRSFDATFDPSNYKLPGEADVFLEAYYQTSRQRFSCGQVNKFSLPTPEKRKITEISSQHPIYFNLKVVDNSGHTGRLLAMAKQIRPRQEGDDEGREYLINVKTRPLDNVVWTVDFSEYDKPDLILNSGIPQAISKVKNDTYFQSLLLPAVMKDVYTYIFWDADSDYDTGSWQKKWLDLGFSLTGAMPPGLDSEKDEVQEWIDLTIKSFSAKHHLCTHLINAITGGES